MQKEIKYVAMLATILSGGCGRVSGDNSITTGPLAIAETYDYHGPIWSGESGQFVFGDGYFERGTLNRPNCAGIAMRFEEEVCIETVLLDGIPTDRHSLKSGQIVELFIDPRTAVLDPNKSDWEAWIDIRQTVAGPVESVDAVRGQLMVLGQRVYVTDQTRGDVDPLTGDAVNLATIAIGDPVVVSGQFSANGQIMATRIEHATAAGPALLRGILSVEATGMWRIGDEKVDLSAAAIENFPGGTPVAGDSVLIIGDQPPQSGPLAARTVRYAGGIRDSAGFADFNFTGFVTAAPDTHSFAIGGYSFGVSTWGCAACNELTEPLTVGAFISYSNDKSLTYRLRFHSSTSGTTFLSGHIDSIDLEMAAFNVAGFTVQTSPATHIVGNPGYLESDEVTLDTLALNQLAVGDIVTVYGGVLGDIMVAGLVVGEGQDIQILTQQYERADPAIVFLGQSILTDANTSVTFCSKYPNCDRVETTWLFDNTESRPPTLTIDIDPDVVPLRATKILAIRTEK